MTAARNLLRNSFLVLIGTSLTIAAAEMPDRGDFQPQKGTAATDSDQDLPPIESGTVILSAELRGLYSIETNRTIATAGLLSLNFAGFVEPGFALTASVAGRYSEGIDGNALPFATLIGEVSLGASVNLLRRWIVGTSLTSTYEEFLTAAGNTIFSNRYAATVDSTYWLPWYTKFSFPVGASLTYTAGVGSPDSWQYLLHGGLFYRLSDTIGLEASAIYAHTFGYSSVTTRDAYGGSLTSWLFF